LSASPITFESAQPGLVGRFAVGGKTLRARQREKRPKGGSKEVKKLKNRIKSRKASQNLAQREQKVRHLLRRA